jgi:hypothetical protein
LASFALAIPIDRLLAEQGKSPVERTSMSSTAGVLDMHIIITIRWLHNEKVSGGKLEKGGAGVDGNAGTFEGN